MDSIVNPLIERGDPNGFIDEDENEPI